MGKYIVKGILWGFGIFLLFLVMALHIAGKMVYKVLINWDYDTGHDPLERRICKIWYDYEDNIDRLFS